MQGTSRSADSHTYRRIALKSLELVLVSRPVAFAFCGRLLGQQPVEVEYFDPERDWPKPIYCLPRKFFCGDGRNGISWRHAEQV